MLDENWREGIGDQHADRRENQAPRHDDSALMRTGCQFAGDRQIRHREGGEHQHVKAEHRGDIDRFARFAKIRYMEKQDHGKRGSAGADQQPPAAVDALLVTIRHHPNADIADDAPDEFWNKNRDARQCRSDTKRIRHEKQKQKSRYVAENLSCDLAHAVGDLRSRGQTIRR